MKLTKIGILCANLFCVFAFCFNVHAAPGDLDTTFDGDGKTSTEIGGPNVSSSARDVLIQPDGRILLLGMSRSGANDDDVSLARYNANGSPDTSFGTGGKVYAPEAGFQVGNTLAIQTDGKILVVGYVRDAASGLPKITIFRYNQNGSVDTTFGANGRIIYSISNSGAGNSVVFQPDGKIVIAGSIDGRFGVTRLNADFSLDTSFNSVGYNSFPDQNVQNTSAAVVLVQPDGKIVAGGKEGTNGTGGLWTRLNADGTLEGAFIRTNLIIADGALQTDGKVVFAGRVPQGDFLHFAITRFNADKTLDKNFGNFGVNTATFTPISVPPFSIPQSDATSLVIQSDGRIIVGGHNFSGNEGKDFALARFNSHGFLDVGFGDNGKVITRIGGEWEEINALALQPDGKVVAAGYVNLNAISDYAVARYDAGSSNTMPTRAQFDYDGDGRSDVSVFRPSTGEWFIFYSLTSTVGVRTFGIAGDAPVPADYDADARTDIAIRRPSSSSGGGWWYSLGSGSGSPQQFPFAPGGDYARPGDFSGDGQADIITYNSSNSLWARMNFTNAQSSNVTFGINGDKPLLGDFDGDGKVDPAIYRPSTGDWWWQSSVDNIQRATHWGISTDIPAPADFDGDFKTDFAVYRPSTGVWYIVNSSNGSFTILNFGLAEDKPVPADYDGDGKSDIAVFRPSTGVWYMMRSTQGFAAMQFGVSTDIPTPNAFIP